MQQSFTQVWIPITGVVAAIAMLLLFANVIRHLCQGYTLPTRKRRSLPRPGVRPARSTRNYYVFLKYKITRRIPALIRYHYSLLKYKMTVRAPILFRYHYSVWSFRLRRTYPRLLRSRISGRLPKLNMLAGADQRRRFLKHFDRLGWLSQHPLLLKDCDRLGCLSQHPPIPLKYRRLRALKCWQARLPKIAIVTPSYNQGRFLEETIRSVLENGYPLLEYAVVDGESQDETPLILERYSHRLAYWASEPDRGQSHAIQKGFKRVNGDVMGYLNSDDILLPGALQFVATYFARHPEVHVVYGHRILINEAGSEIGRWILPPHSNEAIRRADYIPQETLFWRSELYWRIGGIDTSFRFAMDWDLILRFQAAGVIFDRVPFFLACFRVHDSQKTSSIRSIGDTEVELLRERELGKDRSAWNLQEYDEETKYKAFITELAAKCGLHSTRL
jgi:hypothetical protein